MAAFKHVILALVVLCSALPLRADEFSKFRIPTHHVMGWTAQLEGAYQTHNERPLDSRSDIELCEGRFFNRYDIMRESERTKLRLTGFGSLDGLSTNRDHRVSTSYDFPYSSHESIRLLDESWWLEGVTRYYPFTFPLGVSLEPWVWGQYAQNWSKDNSARYRSTFRDVDSYDGESWRYEYQAGSSISIGVGKVRDVTGVASVLVMEERLLHDHVINRPLSEHTRQRLAELVYRKSDFAYEHEFADKYFWQEVESILQADSALANLTLDAQSLYRLSEPDYVTTNVRQRGWFLGFKGTCRDMSEIYRSNSNYRNASESDTATWDVTEYKSYSHYRWHVDDIMLGIGGEFHLPLGLRWQVDGESSLLFPGRLEDRPGTEFTSTFGATYFLTDRWLAAVTFLHTRSNLLWRYDLDDYSTYRESTWQALARAEAEYRIADHLSFAASAEYSQAGYRTDRQDVDYFGPSRQVTYDSRFFAGVRYHISGISIPTYSWLRSRDLSYYYY